MALVKDLISLQSKVMCDTPVGPLTMIAAVGRLFELRFGAMEDPSPIGVRSLRDARILVQTERELGEFFAGKRRTFSIDLTWRGTPFQNRVWKGLGAIPFGETCSYSVLARRIGSPQSARAVGVALGRNPIAIVVPCHRVIGADGSLVGFGGGLEIKRTLLELESEFA
jgi:methylated-DNA-[protein]-cysteine S-methyltransferase